jgi:hypothetical protein
MTEFDQEMRKRCRNFKCGSKLAKPVSNPSEAFCARGCHTQFYRSRCLVCEGPMERKSEQQKLCKKSKCRNAWNRGFDLGRYGASKPLSTPSRIVDSIDPAPGPKGARGWHIVAGLELTPDQFRAATVPDGSNCQWKGGDYERIEAKNKAALKAAEEEAIEAGGYFAEPEWREVISPDGVTCFVSRFRDGEVAQHTPVLPPIPDDLSIPEFLRRPLPQPELRLAARPTALALATPSGASCYAKSAASFLGLAGNEKAPPFTRGLP